MNRSGGERQLRARKGLYETAQRGATAIEYGLIAALVAVVIITGLTALGSSLDQKFSSVADKVQSTGGGAAPDEDETATEAAAPTASASATSTATSLTSEPPGGNGGDGDERLQGCMVSEGGNEYWKIPCKDPQQNQEVCYE